MSHNEVRENQHWAGIMNHGGQRILFDSNQVWDTDVLYAQTVSACPNNGSYTMVQIDNPPVIAPDQFTVNDTGDRLQFSWIYSEASIQVHDSFLIQYSVNSNGPWNTLAFRPANHVYWTFNAPTNPHWTIFNPLQFEIKPPDTNPSYFRIRAQYKSSISPWTYTNLPN